eukprot:TRINITY_DN708_c0_g2_i1.p1 TRINITY_DN708_c0_g2~~TRINITY_DN708_c0_g2_i1.p1  ORF type:complete len:301 (-),score=116.29 TRINITY_DN708_c0_g2_i1:272-1174(-)
MWQMMEMMMGGGGGGGDWDGSDNGAGDDGHDSDGDAGKAKGKGKGKKGKGMGDMFAMMSMMKGMKGGKGGFGFGGKGMSLAAKKVMQGERVYAGKLQYWDNDRNSGFIYCGEVMQEAGQQVYAFRKVLEKAQCDVGDDLAFFLHWSERGQPQASTPMLRLSSSQENNLVLKGTFKKAGSKDYGFIKCQETEDYFGRDVYVGAQLASTLEEGQLVAFNVMLNREGMPNASMICPCDETYAAVPGELTETKAVEGKGKKGFGHKGVGKSKAGKNDNDIFNNLMSLMGKGGKGKGGDDGYSPY